MNRFLKFTGFVMICSSLLFSFPSIAHNKLVSTTPTNGEVFSEPPENVTLRFNDETYLIKFELRTASGEAISLDFSSSIEAKRSFAIALPSELAVGIYVISWTIEGADTHQLSGDIEFEIIS